MLWGQNIASRHLQNGKSSCFFQFFHRVCTAPSRGALCSTSWKIWSSSRRQLPVLLQPPQRRNTVRSCSTSSWPLPRWPTLWLGVEMSSNAFALLQFFLTGSWFQAFPIRSYLKMKNNLFEQGIAIWRLITSAAIADVFFTCCFMAPL